MQTGDPRVRPSLLLAAGMAAAAGVWALAAAASYRFAPSDLTQDYLSAHALRRGEPVYAPLPAGWALAGETGEVVNDHPPPYILALAPLGRLTYPTAFLLLAALNAAACAASVALLACELGWSARAGAAVLAGMLFHPGTVACLCVGNVSLLLLLLVTAGWRAFRRNRLAPAGAWLGLAAALKLYPGLLVVGLAGRRNWRGAVTAAVVAGACWSAAALAVGLDDVTAYARVRAPANARAYVGHGFNLSVAGAAHRTFGPPNAFSPWLDRAAVDPDLAGLLSLAARGAVGVAVVVGWFRARGRPDYADRVVAVLVPGMLLLSPLTWLHAVPMMLIPVVILARGGSRPRLAVLAACAAAMCLNDHWAVTQWVRHTGRNVPPELNLVLLAPTWGMLGVLGVAAAQPRRSPEGR